MMMTTKMLLPCLRFKIITTGVYRWGKFDLCPVNRTQTIPRAIDSENPKSPIETMAKMPQAKMISTRVKPFE